MFDVNAEEFSSKRVVTAEVDGEPRFVAPRPLEPDYSHGYAIWRLGGHDRLPISLPAAELPPEVGRMFPPASGFRVYRTVIPPDGDAAEEQGIPGLDDLLEDGGFHRTETVDVVWVLAGEVGLELAPGRVEWLAAGDLAIQNGTRHAWRNRTDEVAVLGSICLGAERHPEPG